jgi:hypothetical protein
MGDRDSSNGYLKWVQVFLDKSIMPSVDYYFVLSILTL